MHEEENKLKTGRKRGADEETTTVSTPYKTQQQLELLNVSSISNKKVEDLIINFVINDLQPLSIVEGEGFRTLIKGLNSKARVMCTQTLKGILATKITDMKKTIKETLKNFQFVCTTADIWTQHARSYIGVTCHWINPDDFKRNGVTLAFRRFRGIHSYDITAAMLVNIHSEFDLDSSKIVNVVTDNGSNFVKAFKEFAEAGIFDDSQIDVDDDNDTEMTPVEIGDKFLESNIDDSSGIYLPSHVSCFSHTLNLLATTDASKALNNDLNYKRIYRSVSSKCVSLSTASHQSSKAAEIVHEILGRTIPKPNGTRWNSEFDCYSIIYSLHDKVNVVMERLQLPKFSNIDLSFLNEWLELMRPISLALDKLQGEVSMESYFGAVLPTIFVIQRKLQSFTPSYTSALLSALQCGMDKRFGDIIDFKDISSNSKMRAFVVASISHPFFKIRWIESSVREQLEDLFLAEVARMSNSSTVYEDRNTRGCTSADFYGFHELSSESRSNEKVEGLQYLSDPSYDMEQLKRYPAVAKVFLKYNTTVPSSAPVERLFSQAGMILTPKRNRLSDESFETLLLLKKNKLFY